MKLAKTNIIFSKAVNSNTFLKVSFHNLAQWNFIGL